jgi:membrane protein DedA with SNARE-associated domain
VGLIILLEAVGIPLPAESLLVMAAIFSGRHPEVINIYALVSFACFGAIVGDNIGYFVGKSIGHRLMLKYGRYIGLTQDRMLLGRYVFDRWGSNVVLWGRFVTFLRVFAALLAGVNNMNWRRFLVANAIGGIAWTSSYGFGAHLLGKTIENFLGPIGIVVSLLALSLIVFTFFYMKKNENRLIEHARQQLEETGNDQASV